MKNGRALGHAALAAILFIALALRLYNVGFGLPSLYDPDEPLFVMKAVELLADQTLNPRWFGHPGTTTIYLTSLTTVAIFGWGLLVGTWSSIEEFTRAAYADPGLIFIPARVVMVLIAVLCVGMTYQVARRLHDRMAGLIAAALLAINSLHISWSQVIRTDINASLFMLGALYFAIRIVQHGALRDYLLAGALVGIGVATKWPAASVFVAICGASMARFQVEREWRSSISKLTCAATAAFAAIFVSSPFIFLDWQMVVADLSGEARPVHLGHTGTGFLGNLLTYSQLVAGSMGWTGLALILVGAAVSARTSAAARWTLLPAAAAFLATIASQNLIWSRWILPAMPMLVILAAVGIVWVSDRLAVGFKVGRSVVIPTIALTTALPAVVATFGAIRERQDDTRVKAVRWAVQHIPPGSSIALEHLELRLRGHPWKILFPVGATGCIDGVRALQTGIRYDDVNRQRQGIPIVDLGNVDTERLDSCRADFLILTYYDLYQAERYTFPNQVAAYDRLLAGGRTVALYRPQRGRVGGPIVRIVALPHQASNNSAQTKLH